MNVDVLLWLLVLVIGIGGMYLIFREIRNTLRSTLDKLLPNRLDPVIVKGSPDYQTKTCYDCRKCVAMGAGLVLRCIDPDVRKFTGGRLGMKNCPGWVPAKQTQELTAQEQQELNTDKSTYMAIDGI